MNKTVITELRTYIVDSLGKNTVFRQSFSTKIDNTVDVDSKSFTLQPNQTKLLTDVEKLFQLRVDQPVELTITQTGEVVVGPEEPEVPQYYTATIDADNFVAGQMIDITVTDLDIPLAVPEIRVVIFNVNSGETEQLMLQRFEDYVYKGQQLTSFNGTNLNFDSILDCAHNDVIHILYQDAKDQSGALQTIKRELTVTSPYSDTDLQVNSYLHVGKPVAILVIDPDIVTTTYPCLVRNVTTGEEETVLLNRIANGTYIYSLPTTSNMGTTVDHDGVLQVSVGDVVTVTIFDEHNVTTPIKVTSVEVRETVYTNGILSMPSTVVPVSNVTLTFFDYDLAGVTHVDIPVSNTRTGEFEYVRCTETVHGSGSFSGILVLTDNPVNNASGDGVLHVIVGDSIRAVYVDVTSPNASSNVVQYESSVVAATPIPTDDDDEDEDPDDDDGEEPEFVEQSIKLICNGAFVFGGNFNGNITVRALQKPVRCELLFV